MRPGRASTILGLVVGMCAPAALANEPRPSAFLLDAAFHLEGGAEIYELRGALPTFTVRREGAFSALFRSGAHRQRIALRSTPTRGWSRLSLEKDAPKIPPGDGEIVLYSGDEVLTSWRARWTLPTNERFPTLARAEAFERAKRFGEARDLLQEARARAGAQTIFAERRLGRVAWRAGDMKLAESWWRRASESAAARGAVDDALVLRDNAAYIAGSRGDLDAAERDVEVMVQLLGEREDPVKQALILGRAGAIAERRGRNLVAERSYRAILALPPGGDVVTIHNACDGLVVLLIRVGRTDEALPTHDACRNLVPADRPAIRLLNRGEIEALVAVAEERPEDLASAEALIAKARRAFVDSGTSEQIAYAEARLAWVRLRRGDLSGARAVLDELERTKRYTESDVRWLVPNLAAELAIAEGHPRAAIRPLERIAAAIREEASGAHAEAAYADVTRGHALVASGRPDRALAVYRSALEELDGLRGDTAIVSSRADYLDKQRGLVRALVTLLVKRGDVDEAFRISTRRRSILHEDLLEQIEAQRQPERWRAYVERRHRLDARRANGCARLPPSKRAACRDAIDTERDALERDKDELFGSETRMFPPHDAAWLARLRRRLGVKAALVAVADDDRGQVLFWLDRKDLEIVDADSIAERAERAGIDRLYIVPDAEPLTIFEDEALVTRTSVVLIPYAGLLLRDASPATARPLVLADPRGDLPFARVEAGWVAKRFEVDPIVGDDAKDEALQSRWVGARALHLATHGVPREGGAWTAAIALAGSDRLTIEDVLMARPRPGVVVLNGCETGIDYRPHRLDFPQAFLLAGANVVLATTRDVDDERAFAFVRRFYEAGGATSPAAAFAEAIRRSIAADDREWRAFALWGTPER